MRTPAADATVHETGADLPAWANLDPPPWARDELELGTTLGAMGISPEELSQSLLEDTRTIEDARRERRRQATPNYQMREQARQAQELQSLRMQAIAAGQAQPETEQVVYTLPNIRLPRSHKAAFSHTALFEQQRNMLTYDAGLQLVLNALHTVINQMLHAAVPLADFEFIMNFSGAASPTNKHYVAIMRYPIAGQAELIQSIQPDMSVRWSLLYNGSLTIFTPEERAAFNVQSVTVPAPQLRGIVTDSEYLNREGRVIDLE